MVTTLEHSIHSTRGASIVSQNSKEDMDQDSTFLIIHTSAKSSLTGVTYSFKNQKNKQKQLLLLPKEQSFVDKLNLY